MIRFESFEHMISYYEGHCPDSIAFSYDDHGKKSCTFRQFYIHVTEHAKVLKSSGKTCIGILADGSFDCVVNIFAANIAGLQIVMLDENTSVSVLQKLISYADIDVLWGEEEVKKSLLPFLTTGVCNGRDKILFFTSGTTDRAKAVVLTGHSLCQSAYNGGAMLPLTDNDILMCMLPLAHVFGFVCGLLWGLSCGANVALGRGLRHYADDLNFYQPTVLSAVPILLGFLLKHRVINLELRLVLIGAGECPPTLLEAAVKSGLKVYCGYGLTETSSGVALSVGRNPYAMDICPDDRIVLGEDGEILIQAPTSMMMGYYKCLEDTRNVLKNGVLYTGDLGRFDETGRLYIIGRKKEVLLLEDGTKIYLPEYEAMLTKALGTTELAVILKNGRVCMVYSGDDNRQKIWKTLRPLMEDYPRNQQISCIIIFHTPLPRTATGKIRRWELEKAMEELEIGEYGQYDKNRSIEKDDKSHS